MEAIYHTSVLLNESIEALNPRSGKVYVDGTLGGGGHSVALCQRLDASNRLLGLDQDTVALERSKHRLADVSVAIEFIHANFSELPEVLKHLNLPGIDGGLLLDLGVSDFQIKSPERGFSFMHDAPLDMRMNASQSQTAGDLVNTLDEKSLADLFYQYGDEKLSRPIAAAICRERPLQTTRQLASIAQTLYLQKGVKAKNIHPATRLFQALRIAVNGELTALETLLTALPQLLLPGARAAIITFHSLEDRLVKQAFRLGASSCICPPRQPICTCEHQAVYKLIGKAITPSATENQNNPQARSAKLRVVERI